jgi:hypothetical protein
LHQTGLSAGFSPNELDRRPRGIGRPLEYAICNYAFVDYSQLKQNPPIIQLLLEAGADPRLPSRNPRGWSPINSLEAWFKQYKTNKDQWATQGLELKLFFEKPLEAMMKARDELDGELYFINVLRVRWLLANSRRV